VALVVLIAIWGVFLGITLVRKRVEYRADSSIGAFQRQLQVLRRNSQVTNRISAGGPQVLAPPISSYRGIAAAPEGRPDPYLRRKARERRRDVLLILVSILVSTGLISIIPAARMALVLTAIAGVLLVVYVALLVRSQARTAERATKLRYLPPQPAPAAVYADRRVIAR
jgi:hypothetical protein